MLLLNFNDEFPKNFIIDDEQMKKDFGLQTAETLNEVSKQILTSMMKYLYFNGNTKMLWGGAVEDYMEMKDLLLNVRSQFTLYSHVNSKFFTDKLDKIPSAIDKLNKISLLLYKMAKELIETYVNKFRFNYLHHFFGKFRYGLKDQIDSRLERSINYPMHPCMRELTTDMTIKSDFYDYESLITTESGEYNGHFKKEFKEVSKELIQLFPEVYDLLQEGVVMQGGVLSPEGIESVVKVPEFHTLVVPFFDDKPENYVCKYEIKNHKTFKQNFPNVSFFKPILDLLEQKMIGIVLNKYENNLAQGMRTWGPVQKMNLNLDDTVTFRWFRKMLMMFGQIPYDLKAKFDKMSEHQKKIFTVADVRMLI
jgi:hypothetical protein